MHSPVQNIAGPSDVLAAAPIAARARPARGPCEGVDLQPALQPARSVYKCGTRGLQAVWCVPIWIQQLGFLVAVMLSDGQLRQKRLVSCAQAQVWAHNAWPAYTSTFTLTCKLSHLFLCCRHMAQHGEGVDLGGASPFFRGENPSRMWQYIVCAVLMLNPERCVVNTYSYAERMLCRCASVAAGV